MAAVVVSTRETANRISLSVRLDDNELTVAQVTRLLETDPDFVAAWTAAISSPFPAAFLEFAPVTAGTFATQPFQCKLIDAPPLLQAAPDPKAFSEHFKAGHTNVVYFTNLGRDAILVVPTPTASGSGGKLALDFGHLVAFLRHGSEAQVREFWRVVGEVYASQVHARGAQPTWLSTSGLGVPWLHVRLDSRPKYYTFAPYKTLQ